MNEYNNGMNNNGMNEGHELDWDGVIENDGEFIIVPPDDYNFVVKGFDRTRFNGSEKMPTFKDELVKGYWLNRAL